MKLYIKAPYWHNSDFFAHVAEHYVVHQLLDHKERFFMVQGRIEARTTKNGFLIDLPGLAIDTQELISWCVVDSVDTKILKLEIQALMQELHQKSKNTGDILSLFAGKQIMGKDFALLALKKFPLGAIRQYIELWCSQQHMLVVDDAGVVKHKGKQCTSLSPQQSVSAAKWKSLTVKTHDLNFCVFTTKSTSPHMVCVALLLEYLLDATGHWQHRIQQGNYFAPIGYSDFFSKGIMVAWQMGAFTIDKEWFESSKKAFLQDCMLPAKVDLLTDIGLLYGYDFKKQLPQLVQGVTWEEIEKML